MAERGSLPWLILAAVICTAFAIYLESALFAPVVDNLMATQTWQTNYSKHTYSSKRMVGNLAGHLLTILSLGIWVGVLIDARRQA